MDNINHPKHYGGNNNPHEAVKIIEAWLGIDGLKGFCLGNALKYIARAGKKEENSEEQDIAKAQWYLNYYNKRREEIYETI